MVLGEDAAQKTFSIFNPAGERVGLVGESGSGKTLTGLALLIVGLLIELLSWIFT